VNAQAAVRTHAVHVRGEVRRLARHQGIAAAEVERALAALAPHLDAYAEIVLTERGFELITGGLGRATARRLATLACLFGAPLATAAPFLRCEAAFPDRMLGLKLCFGPGAAAPSLYLRTRAPLDAALAFLATLDETAAAVDALRAALGSSRVLYGLGFFGASGELGVKTYTIDDVPALDGRATPGFVSYRVVAGSLVAEHKRYLPHVPWDRIVPPTPRWQALCRLAARELGYETAGHFAITEQAGRAPVLKLYVERIGAVPTDFEAR
jgi:hypothetical protein